jgi:hypothetical protein
MPLIHNILKRGVKITYIFSDFKKLNIFLVKSVKLVYSTMSEQIKYFINGDRIYCGDCSKSYKLKKNGLPPKYFFNHQTIHFRSNLSVKKVNEFLERYKRESEEKTNQRVECECSICYETINSDFCSIPCKHEFHKECLMKMNNDKCPLCRCNMGINKLPNVRKAMREHNPNYRTYQELEIIRIQQMNEQIMLLRRLNDLINREINANNEEINEEIEVHFIRIEEIRNIMNN